MRKLKTVLTYAVLGLVALSLFVVFAPVVPVRADVPGSGGVFTTAVSSEGATSTITVVADPIPGDGLGSITFCFFGQGVLFIDGGYYLIAHPTLLLVGALCPAERA